MGGWNSELEPFLTSLLQLQPNNVVAELYDFKRAGCVWVVAGLVEPKSTVRTPPRTGAEIGVRFG